MTFDKEMKSVIIGVLLAIGILVTVRVFTFKGKPQLRTWHLASSAQGSESLDTRITTPIRDSHPSYWRYNLGLVVPKAEEFELSGRVIVISADRLKTTTLTFDPDSVTRSSWLHDDERISYLLRDDFGMKDGEEYHLEVQFDKPLHSNLDLVLHFLSHTDPEQKKSNKAEMATPRKPSD